MTYGPTTTYHRFDPPRRPEEYAGQSGPHNGLALTYDAIRAIGQAKVTHVPHGYLVRGEWVRGDVRYLDFAIDVGWVTASGPYQLVNGYLRYSCPGCARLSGAHAKGCEWR